LRKNDALWGVDPKIISKQFPTGVDLLSRGKCKRVSASAGISAVLLDTATDLLYDPLGLGKGRCGIIQIDQIKIRSFRYIAIRECARGVRQGAPQARWMPKIQHRKHSLVAFVMGAEKRPRPKRWPKAKRAGREWPPSSNRLPLSAWGVGRLVNASFHLLDRVIDSLCRGRECCAALRQNRREFFFELRYEGLDKKSYIV
jgi:hypothetical protein